MQLLWKSVRRFLKNLKTELPYDPVIGFLSIYPMECKSAYSRDTCTIIAALFMIVKLWNWPRYP
jgi:hypothetical protein